MPSTLGFRLTFEVPQWYAIVAGIMTVFFIFARSRRRLSLRFTPWLRRHVFMPLCFWHLTRLQVAQALAYIAVNALTLSLFIRSAAEIGQRAAVLCTFNMIPLFTTGRVIATILNISIWTYDLWHTTIGFIVVVQGLLHSGTSIATRSNGLRSTLITGWVVASIASLLLLASIPSIRRRLGGLYGILHGVLATAGLAALAIHVLPLGLNTSTVQLCIAGALLLAGTCWRLLLLLKRGKAAYIETLGVSHDMSCVKVTLRDPIRPYPGMYFYLYLSGTPLRNRLAGLPTPTFFWGEGPTTKEVHFIVKDTSAKPLRSRSMRVEGPYGQNLHLERYDSVLLFAESTGVAGIMPYALHLLRRRRHDLREKQRLQGRGHSQTDLAFPIGRVSDTVFHGDKTRRVEFILALRSNDDIYWCRQQLNELMALGSDERLICGRIFTFQGAKLDLSIPEGLREKWKIRNVGRMQLEQSFRNYLDACAFAPGNQVAVVSGSSTFSSIIRNLVTDSSYLNMSFMETEFKPSTPQLRTAKPYHADGNNRARTPRPTGPRLQNKARRVSRSDIKVVTGGHLDGQTGVYETV